MGYYANDTQMCLDDLCHRLETTDLIPSHQALLDGLHKNMGLLKKAGCASVAQLRAQLKTAKTQASLASATKIDSDYLVLLRRVIEGFFPKPQPLEAFAWLDKNTISTLAKQGIKNTAQLFEATSGGAKNLAQKTGVQANEMAIIIALSDLSRVQWVSPTFARVLVAAGYTSAAKIAKADPAALCEAVVQANDNARFYKGKVGLRDIKRLIAAAMYVP